jgi:DNA polymerase III delta prime subunit
MEHVIWAEKYRPHNIVDCILPAALKTTFQEIVDSGVVLNMIFAGRAGGGKTTVARAICEELDISYLLIPASESGIDTLRGDIREFVSTRSFDGTRKVVILDEADYLTNATQPALRSFIEEFAGNAAFILTCNHPNRIIPELHSRAPVIEFVIPKDEKNDLQKQFLKRLRMMLDTEGIAYEPQVLAQLIVKYWPDMRRVINELQKYSKQVKRIDSGIMELIQDAPVADLYKAIQARNFKVMREWCAVNNDNDSVRVMRKIYDTMYNVFEKECIPDVVLLIGNYQYQAAFVQDHEVHLAAFLTELMQIAKFTK